MRATCPTRTQCRRSTSDASAASVSPAVRHRHHPVALARAARAKIRGALRCRR